MNTTALTLAIISGLLASVTPIPFQKQGGAPERQLSLQFWSSAMQAAICGAAILVLGLSLGGLSHAGICLASGVFLSVNGYAYFSVATHRGPVSISWAVVFMASVLVAAMGWTLLSEPIRLYQPPGLICFVACLAVMGYASYRTARKRGAVKAVRKGYWTSIIVALIAGSIGGFGMKFKNMVDNPGHDISFILMRSLLMTAMVGIILRFRKTRPLTDRRTVLCAIFSAVAFTATFLLLLRALALGDLSVVFPVQAGSAVLFGVLWAVVRGERPSRIAYVGVALAVASIVLIGLGGRVLWSAGGG